MSYITFASVRDIHRSSVQVAGDPAVAPQVGKFMGVRNGIDIDIWDPENDAFLPRTYGPDSVVGGKVTPSVTQRDGVSNCTTGIQCRCPCNCRLSMRFGDRARPLI